MQTAAILVQGEPQLNKTRTWVHQVTAETIELPIENALKLTSPKWTRLAPRMALSLCLALYLLVMAGTIGPSFPYNGDAIRYLMLSRSLVSGDGYTENHKPIATPHVKFLPGFPTILALADLVARHGLIAAKIAVAGFGLLSLIALFVLFRMLVGTPLASLLCALLAIQLTFLTYSQRLLSEIPYILFSTLALVLTIYRFRQAQPKLWQDLAIAVVMVAAIFTRTIGVALPAAFVVAALLQRGLRNRRRSLIAVLLIVIMAFGAYQVRNRLAAGRFISTYWAFFSLKNPDDFRNSPPAEPKDLLERTLNNARLLSNSLLSVSIPNISLIPALPALFIVFVFVGWVERLVRRRTVVELYLAFYCLILLVWPWAVPRFIVPIAPLLVFYFIYGFGKTARCLFPCRRSDNRPDQVQWRDESAQPGSQATMASIAAVILVLSLYVPITILLRHNTRDMFKTSPKWWGDFKAACSWIGANTEEDVVVLTARPRTQYLISGRKSFGLYDHRAAEMLENAIKNGKLVAIQGPVVSHSKPSQDISGLLARTRGYWHVAYRAGSTYVIAHNRVSAEQG